MTELDRKLNEARKKMNEGEQRKQQAQPMSEASSREEDAHEITSSEEARRARTHRLVLIGALAEKYLDLKGNEIIEIEEKLKNITQGSR